MIAFATQVGRPRDRDAYRTVCRRGLREVMRKGDRLLVTRHPSSIHAAYNQALRWGRQIIGLEALVLLHADVAVAGLYFRQVVRHVLAQNSGRVVAGVCGTAGEVLGIEWWAMGPFRGGIVQRNGGTYHSFGIDRVHAVDGSVLVLSPWAVRELSFDEETYGDSWHAYDVDLCFSCREKGGVVLTAPLLAYHDTMGGIRDPQEWSRANAAFGRKWHGRTLVG